MRIGFDAKRAFFNQSGLGNYSRNLLNALLTNYPENKYILYSPRHSQHLFNSGNNAFEIKTPHKFFHKNFPSLWRSYALAGEIKKDQLDIYHGLSHELPYGIKKCNTKTIVTIHDLIFLRYPELYTSIDRIIYNHKFGYACKFADCIVAVSQQTADDLQHFYNIRKEKIEIIYQGCNPVFEKIKTKEEKAEIKKRYSLPERFILYIGTIEERKNLLGLIKAIHIGKIDIELVAIGRQTGYFSLVKNYIDRNSMKGIHFFNTLKNEDLSAFYQMAEVFVYPSLFEGFGIPILESLFSGTPVITSKNGCFTEAGGPSSVYIDPLDDIELAEAIKNVLMNQSLRKKMIRDGLVYAQNFIPSKIAFNMMQVYQKVVNL